MRFYKTAFAALLIVCSACAEEQKTSQTYKSNFGYQIMLSDDWLIVTPETIAAANKAETLKSLGFSESGNSQNLNLILESIKSGKVEFYYERSSLNRELKNNISAQLVLHRDEVTLEGVKVACKEISEQLPAVHDTEIEMGTCGMENENGISFLAYEYSIPAQSAHVIQYELPYVDNSKLVVVGGVFDPGSIDLVRTAQRQVIKGATDFVLQEGITTQSRGLL